MCGKFKVEWWKKMQVSVARKEVMKYLVEMGDSYESRVGDVCCEYSRLMLHACFRLVFSPLHRVGLALLSALCLKEICERCTMVRLTQRDMIVTNELAIFSQ